MHEMTLYDYLAYSDPDTQQKVMDIIRSRGYQINPQSSADLANVITTFVGYEGDSGLEALAMVHPDRDLILRTAGKLGADAITQPVSANMQAVHGMTPLTPAPMTNQNTHNNTPIIAGLMGIVVLGIVAIIATKK